MNPFGILRNWAKQSILGGIQDAVEEAGASANGAIVIKVEFAAAAVGGPTPAAIEDEPAEPTASVKRKAKAS
jgi:hypothetical protein